MEFRPHDAVAVFARMRPLVARDQLETFLGDGAHGGDVLVLFEVQDGPDMQTPDRGMGIPRSTSAVAFENLGQAGGILRQIGQLDGAILNEGDGFAVVLHRHHDVEPGAAQLRDAGLQFGVGHRGHAAPFRLFVAP